MKQQLTTLIKQTLSELITPNFVLDPAILAYRLVNGVLHPLHPKLDIAFDDLLGIDRQKIKLQQNTRQFLARLPANHVLMTGARGVGKSSLIHALLATYHSQGLRIIEVPAQELHLLHALNKAVATLNRSYSRSYRYLVFCDDLAFDQKDANFRTLKSLLDGSLVNNDQILIYATSNRRHLLPNLMQTNQEAYAQEVHRSETMDDTLSLADRFGLWLSFHPINQEQYLAMVAHHLAKAHIEFDDEKQSLAKQFAQLRGNFSGRLAKQFSNDIIGQIQLHANQNHPSEQNHTQSI